MWFLWNWSYSLIFFQQFNLNQYKTFSNCPQIVVKSATNWEDRTVLFSTLFTGLHLESKWLRSGKGMQMWQAYINLMISWYQRVITWTCKNYFGGKKFVWFIQSTNLRKWRNLKESRHITYHGALRKVTKTCGQWSV